MLLGKKLLFAAWACHNKNYASYQAWHATLAKIFKRMITFDPQEELYHYGKKEMNARFLEVIKKEQPDFIFLWIIYDEFTIDTLLNIRKVSPNTKVVNFFGDDDTLFYNFSRYIGPFCDGSLVYQPEFVSKYNEEGISNAVAACNVDTSNFKPLNIPKKYDVTFIGTPKRDRYEYITFLIKNGINVKIFGAGWEIYPELVERYGGQLGTDDYVRVINESKINLSFSKNYEGRPHFKGRVLEICACKSFVLSEFYEGYSKILKKNTEIVMFNTREELLKQVNYYLEHEKERENIAIRAYKKILNKYSLEKEFRSFFNKLDLIKPKKKVFPKITAKSLTINMNDLRNSKTKLIDRLKGYEYIGFHGDDEVSFPHKEYLQTYSLEHSNADISCCDYYVTNSKLGNYLLFQSKHAFTMLPAQKFFQLFDLRQIMVRKKFFFDNFEKFKKFAEGKNVPFFSKEEVTFISIPLLELVKKVDIRTKEGESIYLHQYEDVIRALTFQRTILIKPYIYLLVLFSIMHQPFIVRRLIRRYFGKFLFKFNRLKT